MIDHHTTVAQQVVAAELARLARVLSEGAQHQRTLGLLAVSDVSTAAAGVASDLYRQLVGRYPGEIDS